MNINPQNPNALTNLPRFAGAAGHGLVLGKTTQRVENVMGRLERSRGQQMVVEDFVGFGGLRSALDLMRGFFYGTGALNWPAASERLLREGASIFTDNILSGMAAQGLGKIFDSNGKSFSNGFTDYPTLEAFQTVVKDKGASSPESFIAKFGEHLQPYLPADKAEKFQEELQKIWAKLPANATETQLVGNWKKKLKSEQARDLAMTLGQNHFDLKPLKPGTAGHTFKLDNLLDDLRIFKEHMATRVANKAEGGDWAKLAENSIANTLKAKNWKLGCIALGVSATFAVPFINMMVTRYRYGINYFPGEMGLRKHDPNGVVGQAKNRAPQQPAPSSFKERMEKFGQKHMPYMTKQLKEGNPWPLALALLPLPVAIGTFDVAALKFVNIAKKNVLRNMFDFTKGWPFTAPQQMASMFAVLITSRLMCARSDNEYRELVLDSFAGWGAWILGTPLLKKAAANLMDKGYFPAIDGKTQFLNGSTIRSKAEIELLGDIARKNLTGKELEAALKVVQRTLTANVWMGAASTAITIAVLGIFTPLLGIKLTQHYEKRKQKREEAQAPQAAATQTPALNGGNPFGYASQPNRFNPALNAANPGFAAGPRPFGFPAPNFAQRPV